MTDFRPRIVITCGRADVPVAEGTLASHYVGEGYPRAVAEAGGLPVLLPSVAGLERELAATALDDSSGLLLAGGTDIHPAEYGARIDPELTHNPDPSRDRFEVALIREAWARQLPILGICRGFQILNVAYGGSLHQHQPHRDAPLVDNPALRTEITTVAVAAGSRLATTLGTESTTVYCLHHQAIAEVGPGLRPVGRSGDGQIEALEDPSAAFVLGVLWHPEQMLRSADATAVYRVFVEAARSYERRG